MEISRYYRNNRTQVAVFAFLHSNPNSADGDGDGILDSDDYWEANPIWSDDNPADLRYQALNPLIRNTLETMYPEINEKYNENNAKRVHLVDNTIYIDCNVCFSTNDAFDDFNTGYEGLPIDDYYNNSFTYAQVIEIAIENAWSTLVYGSDFDFVKGMEIRIITNIIPIDSIYDYEFVEIDVNNQFPGTPHTFHRNNVWKYDSTSTIYLQKWDNRNLGLSTSPLTADQYMRVAAHEFGHVLGICDAYLDNDDKLLLGCTSETYAGRESNKSDSNIMYNNGYVYANDIEMVLEAFSTNEYQYYIERHNTDFLFYKLGYQSKSNVIRQNQRFVDEYHVGVFTL